MKLLVLLLIDGFGWKLLVGLGLDHAACVGLVLHGEVAMLIATHGLRVSCGRLDESRVFQLLEGSSRLLLA